MAISKASTGLQNAEVNTLSKALCELYKANGAASQDTTLAGFFGELEALYEATTEAVNRAKEPAGLDVADARRDAALRAVGKVLEGYAANALESLSAHAAPLLAVFEGYGYKAVRANLATESTLIDSFRKDLSAEGMRGHIEALPGMEETLAALWEAEDAFKAQNLRNTQTAVATADQKSATELRKEILALINDKIAPYLNIMQQVSAATLGTFAQEMEKEISRANASVAARKKSSK